ncbi:MAG: hypothetical protein GXP53_09560 [Deltaproteobacteria bacterium]|nr:hypothetical protein [Deltaproteobacteria bacterium]
MTIQTILVQVRRMPLVIIGIFFLLLTWSTAWGADYFADDMEGASNWTADSPWATTTSDFHSSTTAWTDSPATYYGNDVNVSLTLTTPVDLSSATAPQLVFWHTYQLETTFDYGYVEVSTDGGATWPGQPAIFTGISDGWTRTQVDLTAYAGEASVLIRFRLVTDKTITWDGWTIDDVAIDEAPVQIADLSVTNPGSTTLDLGWTSSLDTDFASYRIYRSTSVGVTTEDTLVTTVTSQATDVYTDTSLDPDTTYYYKVFVFDTSDLATGSKEASGSTNPALFPYPFFDDMEGTVTAWTAGAPWGITTTYQHSGSNAWTDSPGTTYGSGADASLQMTIDMGNADMPVLSFWQRATFDTNSDFGYVEVRKDGSATWERIFFVTGTIASWTEERVDLSNYAGGKVDIRFRLVSDGNGVQSDGWYIDDVRIDETGASALPYPFFDDMDGGATTDANWHTSSWGLTTDKYSGAYAMTDSLQGNYGNLTWSELNMASTISLLTAVHPQLSFWHKYNTISLANNGCSSFYATEYDYGRVYLSTFNGQPGTWNQIGSFQGSQGAWSRVVIDLSAWAGVPNVRIKFVMNDNNSSYGCSLTQAGWTIDDVAVEEAPTEVALSITDTSMHSVDLSWTQNNDGDFSHYEIYRSSASGVSRTNTLIASISTQATTTFTDPVAMIQPGTYFYRIWVFDQAGNYSLASNEVEATYAVPNNSYPFTEDGESGTGQWEWGAPWGLTSLPGTETRTGASSTVWTDSPGSANYPPNANTSLTTFLDLSSAAAAPVLSFWHKYSLEQGVDFVKLEISVDDGQSWTELRSFTGTETSWNQERVNLTAYTGNANLGLRFRLISDGANQQDGWYMDDLSVKEELLQAAYPFDDDMESGIIPWFYSSTWGQVTLAAVDTHEQVSDSIVWTDSPEGSYAANDDTWLQMTIDLGSADMPVLTFWHKYGFEANGDFGYVEIKEVGPSSWQRIYFVTGTSPDWLSERIDLSNYAGKQVDIRFRVVANGSIQSDGWYIDDLTIAETSAAPVAFPFVDPMESPASEANWQSSSWDLAADPYSGSFAMADSPQGNYGQLVNSTLIMANTIDLNGTIHPMLSFRHKYDTVNLANNGCNSFYATEYDYGRVYLSTQKGQPGTWTQLTAFSGSSDWTYTQLDLSPWVGLPQVRIKFVMNDNNSSYGCSLTRAGWTIDDVTIEEAPVEVSLSIDASSMNSVSLSWSQNTEGDFDRYELYRSDTPNVSRNDRLITTVYDPAALTHVDPVSLIQPGVHYYKMWVWDTDGNVSMASNEVQATYSVPHNGYPFIEDGESGMGQWEHGTPWGLETLDAADSYNGQASTVWTDSPGGASYPADANTSMTTFVNLGNSSMPVLTFWHKYFLEEGADFVKLEVSIDNGQTWQQLRAITGVESSWNYERINLANYVGNTNLGLRFRLISDSQTQNDGWFMDDLKIDEESVQASYPFYDDMENGEIPWFYDSPWGLMTLDPADTHTGTTSVVWADSPGGSYAADADSSLLLAIDLGTANMPVLNFWHRYTFEENSDFGYIEVAEHGVGAWLKLYFVTGTSPAWVKEQVDLSSYAGKQVDIRFRITANSSIQSDGWFIDDVSIDETTSAKIAYPFFDDMEGGATATNWYTSSWNLVPDANSGTYAMTDSPLGNYGSLTNSSLIMANTISLQGAVHPQLSFWHKYNTVSLANNGCSSFYASEYDYGRVYLSTYNGQPGTWTQVASFQGSQAAWTQQSVDLSAWAGLPDVRIKFVMEDNNSSYGCSLTQAGWTIDDVRLGEDESIPSFIQMVAGNSQLGQTGVAMADDLQARVYDSDSIPRAGVLVNFVITGGDGSLSAASATSDANGRVSTSLTLGATPGVNTVTATIDGTSETITFSATGYDPGQAMTLGMISGDNQVNEVNLALDNPLVVKVTDILGQPVAGVDVGFNVISGDGALASSAPVATDANGLASDTLTLGASTGPTTVTAASAGLIGSPVTFVSHAVLTGGSLGDDDGDGMPNAWEDANGLDSQSAADAIADGDIDGLSNLEEYSHGTDPAVEDTDNDGMPDGWEVQYGLDPLNPADAANDNDNDGADNLAEYLAGTVPTLVKHFSIAGGTSESMDFYGVVTIDGVPAEPGDEIAVVDPDGVICGQFTVQTTGSYGFMHVYKDDPDSAQDEGAEVNDELTFLVWDASAGVEISPTVSVISGTQPPTWTFDGDSANVDLAGAGVYSVPLSAGWNLISFPVKTCFYTGTQPSEPMLPGTLFQPAASINDVLASIAGQYEVVRSFDSSGAHTYDPALPGFSDLEYIAGGYGYWIKMTTAGNLEISGIKAKAGDSLALRGEGGWNLVGYWHPGVKYSGILPQIAFPAEVTIFTPVASIDDILASISGKYSVVRSFDSTGAHTYDPWLPAGFSDLDYLGPGYGLWIRMDTVGGLSY